MISSASLPVIVITGGAGYIGSHTALYMAQKGYNIIVLDTCRYGQQLPKIFRFAEFLSDQPLFSSDCGDTQGNIVVIKKDFANKHVLSTIFKNHNVQAVMHFAALIEVGESVTNPRDFYANNVVKTISLLETMLDHNIKTCIFSSSCAVYGIPQQLPLTEDHPTNPISPYGKNKLIVEMVLQDFCNAYDLNYVSLRYFNAAGSMPDYDLGEQHKPETHLIPLLLKAACTKQPFSLFGNNHATKDGSCVRDYLHVWDLADAHWKAFEHLQNNQPSDVFNLGSGHGYSVQEIINAVQEICNTIINIRIKNKRAGDPPILIANHAKASDILGWSPHYSNINFIIQTANSFYTRMAHKHVKTF